MGIAAWGGGIIIVAVLLLDPLDASQRRDGKEHALTGFQDASKQFADKYLLGISGNAVEARQRSRLARRALLREQVEEQWNGAPEWVRRMSGYKLQRPPPLPSDVMRALEQEQEAEGRRTVADSRSAQMDDHASEGREHETASARR